jgi:hypothetical protein
MVWWVSCVSLVLSVLSFLLFAITILRARPATTGSFGDAKEHGALEGWAKVGEAAAKVIDSLSKAGPSALTLTSSIVFMIISFLAGKA